MTQLEYLLSEFNFPKRVSMPKTSIDEIEQEIHFSLPDDYKFYLSNYQAHEQMIGPEYVGIWDIDKILDYNKGYEIFSYLPLTVAIGTNGGGDFIGIEFAENQQYRIVLSPFIDLDKQCHICIGNSFTDFFVRLNDGKEWFS